MKKQFTILAMLTACIFTGYGQRAASISLSLGRAADPPLNCASGAGSCFTATSPSLKGATLKNTNIGVAYFDTVGRMSFTISKINIEAEFEKELLAGKEFYALSEDTVIGEGINPNEERSGSKTVLRKGWYPIIETEDSYVISFTLKNE